MKILKSRKPRPEPIDIYDSPEYIKSQRIFYLDGAFTMIIGFVVGGSYLAGYLKLVGVPVALIGVINSFPILCSIAQVMGAFASRKLKNDKKLVVIGAAVFRYFFAAMYMIAVLLHGATSMVVVSVVLFMLSCILSAFIGPPASAWIASLTRPEKRGEFMGIRESVAMVCTALVLLAVGNMLDYYKDLNNEPFGFMLLGVIIAVCNTINTTILIFAKRPPETTSEKSLRAGLLLRMPLRSKRFRPVLIISSIYQIAAQVGVAYWGLYLVSDLRLSYTLISLMSFITMFERSLLALLWGRLADKTSWPRVTSIMFMLIGLAHTINTFLIPMNAKWLYPVVCIIASAGWSAMGICLFNIQFEYAPR
ncbi:MAG: MFS transporter, partial [Oscillospiraceae bacterium]|nr:MFS transporter [Oscillospiraceae bacterium]